MAGAPGRIGTVSYDDVSAASDPLSSAAVRFDIRPAPRADVPSVARPLALRSTVDSDIPPRQVCRYDPVTQVGADSGDLVRAGKEWKTKFQSDGDEGPEETFGWEEG